jgi:flagellar biosynthesis protein FlhG
MIDQASELRKLVLRSVRQQIAHAGPAPRLLGITSGRSGVGVTTLAVNLSVAFAEHGSRVVLVDADLRTHDVAMLCGVSKHPAGDSKTPRRDIHEMVQLGPAGIQVVPRVYPLGGIAQWSDSAQDRLLHQLQTLGRHAEIVVLDAGDGTHRFQQRCCQAADDVLLVTTSDVVAVMDTYAHLKRSLGEHQESKLHLVVNRCRDVRDAGEIHRRLDQSCRRFLSRHVPLSAAIPHDVAVPLAATKRIPFVLSQPAGRASSALSQLATLLLQFSPGSGRTFRDAA